MADSMDGLYDVPINIDSIYDVMYSTVLQNCDDERDNDSTYLN